MHLHFDRAKNLLKLVIYFVFRNTWLHWRRIAKIKNCASQSSGVERASGTCHLRTFITCLTCYGNSEQIVGRRFDSDHEIRFFNSIEASDEVQNRSRLSHVLRLRIQVRIWFQLIYFENSNRVNPKKSIFEGYSSPLKLL